MLVMWSCEYGVPFHSFYLTCVNLSFFVRVELMDYLDSIDCSLEDFQAMLYGKQCGIDFDTQEVR